MASAGNTLSLKARAIGLLSRREHSRSELRRKLAAHCDNDTELDALLDSLESGNWLSEQRFAESVVHRRAPRHGMRRIMQELRQHGLPDDMIADSAEQLRATELQRAHEVWLKRFGAPPVDAREHARQYRYMMARGFSADCLRRILAGQGGGFDDELPPDSGID